MTDAVWTQLIVTAGAVLSTAVSGVLTLYMRKIHTQTTANATNIDKIGKATDGMKDALVAATRVASLAEGKQDQIDQQAKDVAMKALGVAEAAGVNTPAQKAPSVVS